MSDVPDQVWLEFQDAERLPNDGQAHDCDTIYQGINTSCPDEATHTLVFKVRGEVNNSGETVRVNRCDDCGRPGEVMA